MISNLCENLIGQVADKISPCFIGELPSQSDEGVAFSLREGEQPITFFGTKQTLFRPYVTCLIRTKEYSKGSSFAKTLIENLDEYKDEDQGILMIRAQNTESYVGRNEEKLHEFQLTFRTIVKE